MLLNLTTMISVDRHCWRFVGREHDHQLERHYACAGEFFAGDRVTFGDGPRSSPSRSPAALRLSKRRSIPTPTPTRWLHRQRLAGSGNLEKSGASILTLVGPNTYSGQTVIGGGVLSILAANSLGNASATNTIALSSGGRLRYTGTAAIDLGATRSIAVGTGGGTISQSGTANVTMTIPGNITGSGNLAFRTTGTSGTVSTATTYSLTGDNSGYTGNISIEAGANILSTLNLATQSAVPNAASITVNYPEASITNQNANTLNLPGVTLPVGTTLNMTAFLNGAISLRSQVTSSGGSTINGPIKLTANAGGVVQFVPAAGATLTFNGNIGEASLNSFGGVAPVTLPTVFFRAAANTTINGTTNLPNADAVRVDDTGITTINSTGNVWARTTVRSASTPRLEPITPWRQARCCSLARPPTPATRSST